jgi:metacaspase-1
MGSSEQGPAGPFIVGPEKYDRSNVDPPEFRVVIEPGRFYAVEVTKDPGLFTAERTAQRTAATFYGSWQDGLLAAAAAGAVPARTTYRLPPEPWRQLRLAERLYYRVITSSSADGWTDVEASVPSANWQAAPSLALFGRFEEVEKPAFRSEELRWRQEPKPDDA